MPDATLGVWSVLGSRFGAYSISGSLGPVWNGCAIVIITMWSGGLSGMLRVIVLPAYAFVLSK